MECFKKLQLLRAESANQCQTKIDAVSFLMFSPCIVTFRDSASGLRPLLLNMRSARISYKHPATLINTIMLMIQYKTYSSFISTKYCIFGSFDVSAVAMRRIVL